MANNIEQDISNVFKTVFNDTEHTLAYIVNTLVPKAESVATEVAAVLGSSATEALLKLAGEGQYASLMGAVVGCVIHSLSDLGGAATDVLAAITAGGLNVKLDEVAISALKTLYNDIKNVLNQHPVVVSVATKLK